MAADKPQKEATVWTILLTLRPPESGCPEGQEATGPGLCADSYFDAITQE